MRYEYCTTMVNKIIKAFICLSFVLILFTGSHIYAKVPDSVLKQKDAVVTVYVNDRNGNHIASGTGFLIDRDGIIVTNCQVIAKWFSKIENILRIETAGGTQFPLEDLISRKCENNLVLIKIQAADLPSVKINAHYKPKRGESITVIQCPAGSGAPVSGGVIRNILKPGRLIQTSISVSRKNSGSPIFNSKGEVIGAAVSLPGKGKNMNLAALMKDIPKQLERYKKSVLLKKNVPGTYQLQKETKTAENADEYFLLGCNYENSNSYKEAVEAYKESLRMNPNFLDAYINLGVVYYKLGKYADAVEAFKEAVKINPNSLPVYNKLGTTYMIRGAYAQALDTFKKAVEIDPNNAEAHFNLGLAYFLTGDKTAAFEEYVTLRDIDKERSEMLRDILFH
jgi:tetratricopeptide (TPR) repeat protein